MRPLAWEAGVVGESAESSYFSNPCNRAVTSVRRLLDDEHLAWARLLFQKSSDHITALSGATARSDVTAWIAVFRRSAVSLTRAEGSRTLRLPRASPSPFRNSLSWGRPQRVDSQARTNTPNTCNRPNRALCSVRHLRPVRAVRPLRFLRPPLDLPFPFIFVGSGASFMKHPAAGDRVRRQDRSNILGSVQPLARQAFHGSREPLRPRGRM